MKRILLAATAVALGSVSYAQTMTSMQEAPKPNKVDVQAHTTSSAINLSRAGGGSSTTALGDTIFVETFGNGLSGDGSNGAWTNNGSSSAAVWEYRGTSTTPTLSTGSRGAYAGIDGAVPIASSTQSNGFMIFDSDYLDNGGSSTNMGNGPAPTPHNGELVSPVIDLSLYNDVILKFNVKYRRFVSDLYVVFSTDGTTWNDSLIIYGENAGTSTNSAHTDEEFSLYVSSYIGGSSTAYMKFFFNGTDNHGNTNGSGYYYAMVDDIYLIEAPDNDLVLDQQYFHTGRDTGNKYYYTNIPLNHAVLDTVYFGGKVSNLGTQTQTNTQVNTYIYTPMGSTDVENSQSVNLASNTSDSLYSSISSYYSFGDDGMGTYEVEFTAESDYTDDVPADNVISMEVNISDTVYARDDSTASTGGRWYGSGQNYEIGSMYTLHEGDTVTSMSVYFMSYTGVGSVVSFNVYSSSDLSTPVVSNQYYTLTANDIDQWATFDLTDTYLAAGDYLVTYETFSDSVLWATQLNDRDADPYTIFVDPDNSGTWYYTSSLPMIRMNVVGFTCSELDLATTGIASAACGAADGSAEVTLDGSACATCFYDWGDASGVGLSSRTDLSAGVYTVTVTDDMGCSSEISLTINNTNAPAVDQVDITDINCYGDADGEITLTMSSSTGTSPFTYVWSNGVQTTSPTLSSLSANTYSVTITDDAGCISFEDDMMVEGPASALSVSTTADDPDFGDASVAATGGTSPYTYAWSSGETTASITDSDGGTLTVTVTDANGCTETSTVTVTPVSTNDISLSSSLNVFPNPSNGTFNIEFNELSGVYNVSIYSTIGQLVETRKVNVSGSQVESFSDLGLTNGIYFVNVNNNEGSEATFRIVVR